MPHHLHAFDDALNRLKHDVMTMASQAQQNLGFAVRGLLERSNELCNQVVADDDEVDRLEVQVDRDGLEVIMKFSPMGADLRRVLASMKVGQQLERISDEAVNIARRARKMNANSAITETQMVQTIFELSAAMVRDAVRAFNDGDLKSALAIEERDQELDDSHAEFIKRMIKRTEEDIGHIKDYVDLMFIVRFLERVGDHAVNIAEDVVYAESAYDIRHGGVRPVVE